MALTQDTGTFNSFSGVDITPIFHGVPIGEIQAISYSINREKAPVYTMGNANPRAYARGKRGIAGSLIFIVFDRHALLETLGKNSRFAMNANESGLVPDKVSFGKTANQAANPTSSAFTDSNYDKLIGTPIYVDQIPPFDVVLAAANEYGAMASMAIYGVEILNENSGFSIDDIVTEQQYTYIARAITFWQVKSPDLEASVGFVT